MSPSITKGYINSIYGISETIRIGVCVPFYSIGVDKIREWWRSHRDDHKLHEYVLQIMHNNTAYFYHMHRPRILEVVYIDSTNDFIGRRFDVLLNVPCDWYNEAKGRLKTGGLFSMGDIKMNETDFLYAMMKETWVYGQWPEYEYSWQYCIDTDMIRKAFTLCDFNCINKNNTRLKEEFDMDIRNNIKDVIFNGPATIIKWTDGTKTVVKCQDGVPDPYFGMAMAIAKKVLGNKGNFNEVFKKWIKEENIGGCLSCEHMDTSLMDEPCLSCNNYTNWEGKR